MPNPRYVQSIPEILRKGLNSKKEKQIACAILPYKNIKHVVNRYTKGIPFLISNIKLLNPISLNGGSIKILGNRIALQDNADISVSGANSGGEILIGGNYLGKGPEPNASATVILGAVAPSKANLFPLSETTVTFTISVILLTILVFFSVDKLPESVNEPVSRGFNCLLSSKAIFFLSQFFPTRFHRA